MNNKTPGSLQIRKVKLLGARQILFLAILLTGLIQPYSSFSHVVTGSNPHPNGCAQPGAARAPVELLTIGLPGFLNVADAGACHQHDQCYKHGAATYCMSRVEDCDVKFHEDLLQHCEDLYASDVVLWGLCINAANTMFGTVATIGDSFIAKEPTCSDWEGRGANGTICPEDADGDRYSGKAYFSPTQTCDVHLESDDIDADEVRTGTIYNPFGDFHRAIEELPDNVETILVLRQDDVKVTRWLEQIEKKVTLAVEPFDRPFPFPPAFETSTIGDIDECPCYNSQTFAAIDEAAVCTPVGNNVVGSLSLAAYTFEVGYTGNPLPAPPYYWSCSSNGSQQTFETLALPELDLRSQRCEQLFRQKDPGEVCQLFTPRDLR